MTKPKRLFFDIETSFNIVSCWKTGYKLNISPENIIKERAIICICYKWEGEKKVHSLNWDVNQSDKTLLQTFIKVANEADELIGHNGDKFDLPWIRTRCLFHKISMFPSYTSLDTLKKARSLFNFNSNKLDYIASFLGLGHKNEMRFSDWTKIVLDKSTAALTKMITYCKKDVTLLEEVYNKLQPYITSKAHHGLAQGGTKCSCPSCGSEKSKLSKTRISAAGITKYQLQCSSCGTYHTVSETTYTKKAVV